MNHFSNRSMIFACTAGVGLQALVTEIPYFVGLFGTVRLSLHEWGWLAALSFVPLVVHELLVAGGIAEHSLEHKKKKGVVTDFPSTESPQEIQPYADQAEDSPWKKPSSHAPELKSASMERD